MPGSANVFDATPPKLVKSRQALDRGNPARSSDGKAYPGDLAFGWRAVYDSCIVLLTFLGRNEERMCAMANLIEQLDRMTTLRPNWDGYGADPPHAATISLAKELVAWVSAIERANGLDRHMRVHPTRVGGVLLEWEDDRYEHELEVYPDGRLELLHENKMTGEMKDQKFNPGAWVINPEALTCLRLAVAA